MRCFVAGGTGVIGRRAVRLLVEAGHDVTALSRSERSDGVVRDLGARPLRASLFDRDAIAAGTVGSDAIVNLATSIPSYRRASKRSAWSDNDRIRTEGVDNLLAAARSNGIDRYVQESVTFSYVDAADRWIGEDHPRTADGDGGPVAHAEAAVGVHRERGGRGVVLRFAMFYDVDSGHTASQAAMVRRRLDPFFGPADAHLSLTGVPAAARAVVAALDVGAGVYNVVDDDPPTRRQVAAALAGAVGTRRLLRAPTALVRRLVPGIDSQIRSQRVRNDAFRTATGWQPDHTGSDGIAATMATIANAANGAPRR